MRLRVCSQRSEWRWPNSGLHDSAAGASRWVAPPFENRALSTRAAVVYSATNETAAGMQRVSDATRLATEQQAIDDEADAQAGHDSQWHARRFDAVLHLDSIVSMLTLGQQGIVRDGLREQLQPAAVAVAFTLYPRRAGDGGKTTAEIVSDGAAYDEGDDVGPSGATRSGSTCRRELPLVVTDSARSDEQHGPLTREQAAALERSEAPADSAAEAHAAAVAAIAFGFESPEVQVAPAADNSTMEAVSEARALHVVPRVRAHYQALGELPGDRAAQFANALDAHIYRRRQQLSRVLDEYRFPTKHLDERNVLCGVRGISYVKAKGDGNAFVWKTKGGTYETLAEAMEEVLLMDGHADEIDASDSDEDDLVVRGEAVGEEQLDRVPSEVWSHDEERLEQLAAKLLATTEQEPAAADERSVALETTEHEQLTGDVISPLSSAMVSGGDVTSGSARTERAAARQLRSESVQDDTTEDDVALSMKRSRRKPPRPTASQVRRSDKDGKRIVGSTITRREPSVSLPLLMR